MGNDDRRRTIPRTDALFGLARRRRGSRAAERAHRSGGDQQRTTAARDGALPVEQVADQVERSLRDHATTSLTPVLNATGVIVHTNLGRAPLSDAAMAAVQSAAGYVDVELDLTTGRRGPRGAAAREALLRACPAAEAALVVNNGAAALLLAITALVGTAGDRGQPRRTDRDRRRLQAARPDGRHRGHPA